MKTILNSFESSLLPLRICEFSSDNASPRPQEATQATVEEQNVTPEVAKSKEKKVTINQEARNVIRYRAQQWLNANPNHKNADEARTLLRESIQAEVSNRENDATTRTALLLANIGPDSLTRAEGAVVGEAVRQSAEEAVATTIREAATTDITNSGLGNQEQSAENANA